MTKLTFSDGFSTSFRLAMSQFWSVLGACLLWLITIWIPYINIGTTIGLIRLQIKLGRGEKISAGEIFDPENRAAMGKIFLLWSFMATGITIGFIFFIIPGIVLWYAWFFSSMLILDKKLDPIQAMSKSYDLTYGYKWVIFFIMLVIQIVYGLAANLIPILVYNAGVMGAIIGLLLILAIYIIGSIWLMTSYGYMYARLSGSKKSKK
tara:strand:- start:4 stop:624 length:621 start_codon:yes stop_codon:yes gene_type:complete